MSSVAHFPVTEPQKPHVRQMALSLLVAELLSVMNQAAELQGGDPIDRSTAEMLIRMQSKGASDKAARAAERATQNVIGSACAQVLEDWDDHSQWHFLRNRVEDIERKAARAGEAGLLTYWKALHFPQYFCRCGKSYTTTDEGQRGICDVCRRVQ